MKFMEILRLNPLLKKEQVSERGGISIITVENPHAGMDAAKNILHQEVDGQTLLLLSGGSQKTLYEMLAQEKRLNPFAIALIDERYGDKGHADSNEKMIRETGLISNLEAKFYPVLLDENPSIEDTAKRYEEVLKDLLDNSKKRIAILGIGPDGHTSGIAPNRPDFSNPLFSQDDRLVGQFNDETGSFKKRITTTFNALSRMDLLIILAFGTSKQEPLRRMFEEGPLDEVPARFYTNPEVAKKTILITDQKV